MFEKKGRLHEPLSLRQPITLGTGVVLCIVGAVAGAVICFMMLYWRNMPLEQKLREIDHIVTRNYVGEMDTDKIGDYAATGYISALDDRWSYYMPQEEYEESTLRSNGQVYGIGVSVSQTEKQIRVRLVYADSPAAKAGIEKGDYIIGAEDLTTEADGAAAVVAAIGANGAEGTVRVQVKKGADGTVQTHELERALVSQTLIESEMLQNNTGYIRIESFSASVDDQFGTALETLTANGAKQLIIDVRHNGGGRVEEMSKILDRLLGEGTIITLRQKDGTETVYTSDEAHSELPLAVLVDENSYSAAEFFAAALQEYDRATIIGAHTTGKGRAQRTYELSDGSAVHLSVEQYFTPKGNNLGDKGIAPDVEATLTEEQKANFYFLSAEQDPQLQKALETLS